MAKYQALSDLHIVRPGEIPSSERLKPGDVFEIEGTPDEDGLTKGLHIDRMITRGAIKKYRKPIAKAAQASGTTKASK